MIPTSAYARLRAAQELLMRDTARVLTHSSVDDAYNHPIDTYTPGAPVACGFSVASSREVQEAGEVVIVDAVMRLPAGTTVTDRDRVRLTHRHGAALATPLDFDVVGLPDEGISATVVVLARVPE